MATVRNFTPRDMNACSEFSFEALYKAYIDCRRHKRKTYHAMKFEENCELELLKLERELKAHIYLPSRSICFVVTEPTLREVFAANFRDRIVHHLLYNYLEPIFEPIFIAQSYACRKGKGAGKSLKDIKKYSRKITKNHTKTAYFMHLDIRGFFMSLKKDVLFRIITEKIRNPEILWLIETVIFHDPTKDFTAKSDKSLFAKIPPYKSLFHIPPNQGLPIGNLTSQFFANVYLNELDQFAKHHLKIKYYLRYVDDFLILSNDKSELDDWQKEIDFFLRQRLGLELNAEKQILQNIDMGIDWLGYIVKPDYILSRKRIVEAFKQKLYFFDQDLQKYPDIVDKGQLPLPFLEDDPPLRAIEKMLATVNSYFGHFKHADTFQLRKSLWETKFKRLNNYIEPKNPKFLSFRIKPDFRNKIKAKDKFL